MIELVLEMDVNCTLSKQKDLTLSRAHVRSFLLFLPVGRSTVQLTDLTIAAAESKAVLVSFADASRCASVTSIADCPVGG